MNTPRPPPWFASDAEDACARVGPAWYRLARKHVFMTGGTGFIGKWLLGTLLHANRSLGLECEVTVLTRDPGNFSRNWPWLAQDPSLRIVKGDVREPIAGPTRMDFLIHGATDVAVTVAAGQVFDTCLRGTRHVLEFAARTGPAQVLLLSSGAAYGRQPAAVHALAESHLGTHDPLDPRAAYGLGKLASEWLVAEHARSMQVPVRVARCFAFVGPMLPMDGPFAIGNFIRDAVLGNRIRIYGDGTPLRTYLYASDMAAWLWRILLEGAAGRIYNVGGSQPLSIAELAQMVDVATGAGVGIELLREPVPGQPAERYVPDVQRAASELGLSAWTDLGTAIRRTADWYRDDFVTPRYTQPLHGINSP